MKLIVNDIDINEAKKVAILLGRDFKDIETKEKKKGREPKKEVELIAEIENKVKSQKEKQTKKK